VRCGDRLGERVCGACISERNDLSIHDNNGIASRPGPR
jgi:hypothetical protein